MAVISSPNMLLPIPVVGTEAGPLYAKDINNSLTIVDQHDHSAGSGVPITPDGLNINASLTFNNQAAINLASVTLVGQTITSLNTVYETTVGDLHYINSSGLDIQITNSTGVAVTPTAIPGLVAPASVEYIPLASTFVWQSDTGIAADMDFGSAIMRNLSPDSTFALTLQPPTLSSDYTITLPTLPGTASLMALDSSGNITAPYSISGGLNASVLTPGSITSTQIAPQGVSSSNILNNSITTTQINSAAGITNSQLATANVVRSGTGQSFTFTTNSYQSTGITVTISTPNARPVMLTLQGGIAGGSPANIALTGNGQLGFTNAQASGSSVLGAYGGGQNATLFPNFTFTDTHTVAGNNTYTLVGLVNSGGFSLANVVLVAVEL